MKGLLDKIKNLFGKGSKVKERKSPIRPYRDWVLIFVLTAFGIALVAAFSTYLLFILQSGEFFTNSKVENSNKAGFEEAKLIETLGVYKQKQDDFNKLAGEKTTIADPSI